MKVPSSDTTLTLLKYVIQTGVCARRKAMDWIQEGKIAVDGQPITEPSYKLEPHAVVTCAGQELVPQDKTFILLNKPRNYLSTLHDPAGRPTILDLVKDACTERVYPIGRLDRNTTGLLLLTNDGDLANRLAHPAWKVPKTYEVTLDKSITSAHLLQLKKGVLLEDGLVRADDLSALPPTLHYLRITIHVGRNRIVRRLMEHLGYKVKALNRIAYANLTTRGVKLGSWRYLTKQELSHLYKLTELNQPSSNLVTQPLTQRTLANQNYLLT